uniref:Uncharacterized protein n=1 Tax=viral metagenome TaxID=1070528 RepID=A0A6C0KUD8_9ZZZZ
MNNSGNISMINLKPSEIEKIYTNEEIQKSIEDTIQKWDIIKSDSERKKLLKLKLRSEKYRLKEVEIKIKVNDGLIEFIKNSKFTNNFYKEKKEKYEINKDILVKLKENILLEIEIIKSQLPPSS